MPTIGGIVTPTGAEASGRRSLREIIDELARPIDASDDRVRALAGDAFRAAVRVMNRKGLWPWEILDEDITTGVTEAFSTVTSAIKKPLAMHHLESAGGIPDRRIAYLPYDRFVEKYSMDIDSDPHTYTIPNLFETGQIRWFPRPSSADNYRFTFYRVTPAPRTEDEPVEIPDHAVEVYMSYAWFEFLKRLPTEQRPFDISVAMTDARQAFRELSAHVESPGDRVWASTPF